LIAISEESEAAFANGSDGLRRLAEGLPFAKRRRMRGSAIMERNGKGEIAWRPSRR